MRVKYIVPFMLLMLVQAAWAGDDAKAKDKPIVGLVTKLADIKGDIVATLVSGKQSYKLKATGDAASQIAALDGKKSVVKGKVDGDTIEVATIKEAPKPKNAPADKK